MAFTIQMPAFLPFLILHPVSYTHLLILNKVKADIRNPLRYLLITHIMSEFISLMIQASPYPLLIAPHNLAGDLLDSVKMQDVYKRQDQNQCASELYGRSE